MTPLDILKKYAPGFLTEVDNKVVERPPYFTFKDLLNYNTKADPDELIRNRFLGRGGACLVAGPTGAGKSSFLMHLKINWALGQPFLGITPVKSLRIGTIQAENDQGDMAEMLQGVYGHSGMADAAVEICQEQLVWTRVTSYTGEKFCSVMQAFIEDNRLDIVCVDPAFAFLGGSASDQAEVTSFLRNNVNPILERTKAALMLIHHTNKPQRETGKENWNAGDFAYAGAGSAEWANFCRAVLTIQNTKEFGIFKLLAAKRGSRIGWTDDGQRAYHKYISHASEVDKIYWREATPDEISLLDVKRGSAETSDEMVLSVVRYNPGLNQADLAKLLCKSFGKAKQTWCRTIKGLVDEGFVAINDKRHYLSQAGQERPKVDIESHQAII